MEMQAALWWTPEFVDRFEKGRGYSPIKYLPLMFHQSNAFTMNSPPYNTTYDLGSDASDQSFFIQDYRTTLNEGYLEYLGTYEAWAQSLGLSHSCQVAYNLPLDMVRLIYLASASNALVITCTVPNTPFFFSLEMSKRLVPRSLSHSDFRKSTNLCNS